MSQAKADGHAHMVVWLEKEIREAKAEVARLENQLRLELEAVQANLAGVGEVADRGDGKLYVLSDDLADGASSVRPDVLEANSRILEQFGLAPRKVEVTKYPTIAEIRKRRHDLRDAGVDWRDLIDEAPRRVGLRLKTPDPNEED